MTQHYGPFDTGAGDAVTSSQWRDIFKWLNGIITAGDLAVSAGTGMAVNVGTGKAMTGGLWYYNDASLSLAIAAANPSNPRIDLVVIQADLSAQTVAAVVKTGTPAGSPVAPTVEQDASKWEIALAQVLVPAGASSSASFTITDERVLCAPWTASNDGSGSGLDADKLDGHDSSFFSTLVIASAGGGSAGVKIWVGTTDPAGSASEGDIWISA